FMIVVLASRLPPELRSGSAAVAAFLGLLMWPEAGRLTRSAVGQARREDYVVAAYALGLSRWRILWRHVLPNTMTPLLVSASFTAAGVVLVDATLSFLGLGQESAPGWGRVLHDARSQASLGVAWHLAVFPGLLAFLCVLSFITIGDALRRAADPRR
ncbi:MAG: ABC transporter permease, partial [Planctomycetes bacterium]|nr:ABC transporter permease [Planctomycetota bacterium]